MGRVPTAEIPWASYELCPGYVKHNRAKVDTFDGYTVLRLTIAQYVEEFVGRGRFCLAWQRLLNTEKILGMSLLRFCQEKCMEIHVQNVRVFGR